MRLLSLKIRNFQGIKGFTFQPDGNDATVFADNGVGKSTIFSAFNWLLFGKNSQGQADFAIKPLTADGQPIHNLETEVEGTFEHDGTKLVLKKVLTEKYTKQRGKATADFTGHSTDYWIDEVPNPKKDYDHRIACIADEKLFKLVTSPNYFNEQLSWQDRRKLLLDVCGDVSDGEVIANNKDLEKLPNLLEGHSLEDYRKIIAEKQGKINGELKLLPVRIDEATRAIPVIEGIDFDALPKQVADLRAEKQLKEDELSRVRSGGEIAEKQKQIREVESRIIDIKNKHRAVAGDDLFCKQSQLQELQGQYRENESKIELCQQMIDATLANIQLCTKARENLRAEWHQTNNLQVEYTDQSECPTCGQALPEEQLESARATALENHNLFKAQTLEGITSAGIKAKTEQENLEASLAKHNIRLTEHKADKDALETQLIEVLAEIEQLKSLPGVDASEEYKAAIASKVVLEQAIVGLQRDNQSAIERLCTGINFSNQAIASVEARMALARQREVGLKRIDDLKAQEKALGAEYERLAGNLFLTEQFVRTRVSLLEGLINSKFQYARFKLFIDQINGGVNECCETLYGGVPYGSGLNLGHRVVVGLDIIKTVSKHYGFTAPIFVDNAESITTLPEMNAQVIRLVKPGINDDNRQKYSKLVVEGVV